MVGYKKKSLISDVFSLSRKVYLCIPKGLKNFFLLVDSECHKNSFKVLCVCVCVIEGVMY